jgi:sugar lactone lactonase YvrE
VRSDALFNPTRLRAVLVTSLCVGLLTACNGNPSSQSVLGIAPAKVTQRSVPASSASEKLPPLYALSIIENAVTIYGGKSMRFLRSVSVDKPASEMAVDASGHLYVANDDDPGSVSVFSNRGKHLFATISDGINEPHAVALDPNGNLFVANFPNVNEYAARTLSLIRVIKGQEQHLLACDTSGNIYIANDHAISVYGPGETVASYKIAIKGGRDFSYPFAMTFDTAGNLYVALGYDNSVKVYAAGSSKLLRTITAGISYPAALAFDSSGNLFVANAQSNGTSKGGNDVTVYAPESTSVSRTISDGMDYPFGLAFDAAGNLYVSDTLSNSINVYAPGSISPQNTITQGLYRPSTLAMGP